jgi:hypothetical protein
MKIQFDSKLQQMAACDFNTVFLYATFFYTPENITDASIISNQYRHAISRTSCARIGKLPTEKQLAGVMRAEMGSGTK